MLFGEWRSERSSDECYLGSPQADFSLFTLHFSLKSCSLLLAPCLPLYRSKVFHKDISSEDEEQQRVHADGSP